MEAAISASTIFWGCCIACCSSQAISHQTDEKTTKVSVTSSTLKRTQMHQPYGRKSGSICIPLAKAPDLRSDIKRNYTDVTKFYMWSYEHIFPWNIYSYSAEY